MHDGEHANMDPFKGGMVQEIITFFLKIFLHIAYFFLNIVLKTDHEELIEPKHLIAPPEKPIPSLKLAQALNPNTPVGKLVSMLKEEDPFVRRALCRNPSVPFDGLVKLSEDSDFSVKNEAKEALDNRKKFDPQGYKLPAI